MDWISIVLIIVNLILTLVCFMSWRRVWGLQGGYGNGVWAEGYGGYLADAKELRITTTVILIIFTCLHVNHYLNYF